METQRPEPHRRTRGIGPKSSIQASCSAQWLKITKARRTLAMQSAHTLFTSSIGVVWLQQILCRHTISKEHMNIVYIYIYIFFYKAIENRIFQHVGRLKSKYYYLNMYGKAMKQKNPFQNQAIFNDMKNFAPKCVSIQVF